MSDLALAVDIGGTKMAAGLVDRAGTLSYRAQVPTPATSLDATKGDAEDRDAVDRGAEGRDAVDGEAEGGEEGDAAELLWRTLRDLVAVVRQQATSNERVVVCGVGCGGPMSPGGETVSPLNIGGWRDFPLRARLHELTGVPTFVDNDAKAFALGEGWTGAAAGCKIGRAHV